MTLCKDCGREWTGKAEGHCAYCHEQFSSYAAYDRHLVTRNVTVQTRRGPAEDQQVRCRPVEDFTKPMRNGKPRLVAVQRASGRVWVTALRDYPSEVAS